MFVLFATCKKDRNRLFKTKVHGTVLDYFDLKPVEGVKVSVVYTYDFLPYSWPYGYPPPNGYLPPCKEPDTLEQTYTNANGEFELKFPVKKNVDDCGLNRNVVHSNNASDYGYLLIFEKPGTDYFKQYYSLGFADKNNINVLYRIRSLVTLVFNVSTNDTNNSVGYNISAGSDLCLFGELKQAGISGINLNTSITLKVPFCEKILTKISHNIWQSSTSTYFFFESKKIIFNKKKYEFYASY
ncbi:MAG: hypothetical protein D8M18_05740 [Bacteroidetes bacterium]|nr:hypothetical protein [Bacteroidota bacterium]